ncbi:MAG: hypothetical protein P9L91_07480, partial [Candidatus Zophobacter franzmannii]|nr:hypothetical protein [Candidatus Zophobacter franzmannii]
MKRYSIVILLLVFVSLLMAAEMIIAKPLLEDTGDLTLRRSPINDFSGNSCALVKISTDLLPLGEIESNRTPVKVVYKTGEVWVYLSAGEKRLYFNKTGFARKKYEIPLRLKSNTVYTMTLLGKG